MLEDALPLMAAAEPSPRDLQQDGVPVCDRFRRTRIGDRDRAIVGGSRVLDRLDKRLRAVEVAELGGRYAKPIVHRSLYVVVGESDSLHQSGDGSWRLCAARQAIGVEEAFDPPRRERREGRKRCQQRCFRRRQRFDQRGPELGQTSEPSLFVAIKQPRHKPFAVQISPLRQTDNDL